MKRYTDLTEAQKKQANEKAFDHLFRGICIGAIRFDDAKNNDDLQARIDAAFEKENPLDKETENELRDMAEQDAVEAFYPEDGELAIQLKWNT